MDMLSTAFEKIILAMRGRAIPETPEEIRKAAHNQSFKVVTGKGGREVVIISAEDVHAIHELLLAHEVQKPQPGFHVGDTVVATYNGEDKIGVVDEIYYHVEGCGRKHFTADELGYTEGETLEEE